MTISFSVRFELSKQEKASDVHNTATAVSNVLLIAVQHSHSLYFTLSTGSIPSSIGNLTALKELKLDSMKLSGECATPVGRMATILSRQVALKRLFSMSRCSLPSAPLQLAFRRVDTVVYRDLDGIDCIETKR